MNRENRPAPNVVGRLGDGDWPTLRELRLTALADAPTAFWATLADESRFERDDWVRFLNAGAWFTVRRDSRPVGIAAGMLREGQPDPVVISMWVAPDARGTGAARLLLDSVVDWARDRGSAAITLWVTDGNDPARRLYEAAGFRDTGERQRLPHLPEVGEAQMRLPLTASVEPSENLTTTEI